MGAAALRRPHAILGPGGGSISWPPASSLPELVICTRRDAPCLQHRCVAQNRSNRP